MEGARANGPEWPWLILNVGQRKLMTYISFRGVRVSRTNAQWSFRTCIAALVALVVALVADRAVHNPAVAFYGFSAAQALLLTSIVVAVPGVVVPLSLLLAPFGIAVYGATRDREVWTTWWFWVLTAICEVLGGFALAWFGMKYGKRER